MKVLMGLAALAVLCACSSRPKQETRKAIVQPAPARPKIPAAQAKAHYENYRATAQRFYAGKDYDRALTNYKMAAQYAPSPKLEGDSYLGALRSAKQLKRDTEIPTLMARVLEKVAPNDPQRAEALDPQLEGLLAQEKKIPFLTALAQEIAKGNAAAQSRWNARALEEIRRPLASDETEQLLQGAFPSDWKDAARAVVSQAQIAAATAAPAPALAPKEAPLDSKTIGAVLPLSGKNEGIARKTLRGLQLGLGLYGAEPSSFKLAVADSEGRPEGAEKATQRLIQQDGAIAVVGSVLSRNAQTVATVASEFGTPSVSLSQKQGVTQQSPLVFRNTLTAEMQVKTLVKVAMADLGMTRFAVVYPNDAYGVEMANLFWDEVLARGGKIVGAQTYSPDETDFKNLVQKLVGTNAPQARAEEYNARIKEKKDKKKETSDRHADEDILPPVVDFQAVFIPDSLKALGQLSAMLAFSGVRGVHLLGPNLWNNPGLGRRVSQSFNPVTFVDFPPMGGEADTSEFSRLYRQQFNEDPGPFELQGYDAALLLRTLISEGARDRQSLATALAEQKTFPGGHGTLVQFPVREFHRPLSAWTLEKGQIVPLLLAK